MSYPDEIISVNPIEEAESRIQDSLNNSILNLLLETSTFSSEEWRKYSYEGAYHLDLTKLIDRALALTNLGFSGRDIIEYTRVGGTVSYASRISNLFSATGYDIYRYRRANIFNGSASSLNFAEELVAINYKDQPVFSSGYNLLRATWLGVSIETAEDLAVLGHNADEIIQLTFLNKIGLSPDFQYPEFIETDRPNLRIVMPYYERNGAFYHPNFLRFLRNIDQNYDTRVTFADTEETAFPFIGKDNLTIIAGHGSHESIQLGGPNQRYFISDERWLIDRSDEELSRFSSLPENSIVVMISCNTAGNWEIRSTLANDLSNFLNLEKNITLYAAEDAIDINYTNWVTISSINPLVLRFYNNEGEEITYISK